MVNLMKKNKNKCNITILAYVFLIFNFINIKINSLGLTTANATTKRERFENAKRRKEEKEKRREEAKIKEKEDFENFKKIEEAKNKAKTRRKTEDDTTETQQIITQSIAIRPIRSAPSWGDVRSSLEKLEGSK